VKFLVYTSGGEVLLFSYHIRTLEPGKQRTFHLNTFILYFKYWIVSYLNTVIQTDWWLQIHKVIYKPKAAVLKWGNLIASRASLFAYYYVASLYECFHLCTLHPYSVQVYLHLIQESRIPDRVVQCTFLSHIPSAIRLEAANWNLHSEIFHFLPLNLLMYILLRGVPPVVPPKRLPF
jgi:hypothetical protein